MHRQIEDAILTQCQSSLTTYAGFRHDKFTKIDSRCEYVPELLQYTCGTVH
jgi:hypothetical protein